MTDLFFLGFVGLFLAFGLKRPFLWVLTYLYIDVLAPQKIAFGFFSTIPISLVAFCAAFGGWLMTDSKKNLRFTLRQGLLLFLLVWCFYTLQGSAFPEPAGTKWDWVWKALFFAIFLPFTLTTRLRMEAAALVMVLSVGAIIISGGLKTVTGGGGYGVLSLFVNDNSGIYESSTLSTVAVGIIPLIIWFTRHGTIFVPDWRVKLFAYCLIFACLLIPVGTVARTGLVCIAVLMVLLLREVKNRAAFIIAGAALGVMALPFVPPSYYERMSTIGSADGDESASTRIAVWEWTLDYVAENPSGGGFDAFRANKFTYRMPVRTGEGNMTSVRYETVTDEARAYHSAFFEVLGEQGYPGFIAWIWLQALGIWQMEKIRRRWRKKTGDGEQWQAPLASALQYAHLIYLVGALFQGIAYQPFVMMLIGLQIALYSYCQQLDSPGKVPIGARLKGPAATPIQGQT
ncbi:putative O-glycosylation ligase, exosortase A system-associated [Parerythrobacter jejuensis]|uniref:Putative O-glycosylation ligase, exosortase A system-associated n=1 Tax=Parerythrobacter jejuensis TaxID=795812 RepID=A0A845AND1_9SPHN|nr:putative O-glycosylation ligase, exosortase A system-associated [Parerythrobacter jejuensis]MXP31124.1 putative O-glycosylation ligase, exosortase A system-associated [Parerythrobacter jejuensis]MXP33884.1 putative O-glycosylation ligase, exosortase A system-associated [Parerythrobacter jejuensis]